MSATSDKVDVIRDKFQSEVKAVESDDKVYIVNAGNMNHGKSSLLNSLLGEEVLSVRDVRETVENREVEYKEIPGVVLIDTPGLAATKADDATANEAYQKAHAILFVHNVKAGELHKDELDEIKAMSQLFSGNEKIFWDNFVLVLSFKDEIEKDEDIKIIEDSCLNAFKSYLNYSGEVKVFRVSNKNYMRGIKENKNLLASKAGITELKEFIASKVPAYKEGLAEVKREQIRRICAKFAAELKDMRKKIHEEVVQAHSQNEKRVGALMASMQNIMGAMESINSDISSNKKSISSINERISYLKGRL